MCVILIPAWTSFYIRSFEEWTFIVITSHFHMKEHLPGEEDDR